MPALESLPRKIGPYRVLEKIGEGGMGVVYLASDAENRPVAVKVLGPAVAGDPDARLRLAREVETMRRVRNRHVAQVLDADVNGPSPYIVTRYVPGPSLDELVRRTGPLRGQALLQLAGGLAEALAAIHAAGVVHRDLKPGNVLLDDGQPVVIDFGIAHLPDTTRLTKTGLVMGTPGYLSPEVIEGRPASGATDVHAWGATVAYAATGRPPYGTGDFQTVFFRIIEGRAQLGGVPPQLLPLVTAALSADPPSRPTARSLVSLCAASGVNGATLTLPGAGGGLLAPIRPNGVPAYDRPPYRSPVQAAAAQRPQSPAGPQEPGTRNGDGNGRAQAPPVAGLGVVGFAALVGAVALSVLLPVAGTILALAVITLLRAADMAQTALTERRSLRGARPSDLLRVTVTAPWTVVRAVLKTVFLAPLALLVAVPAAVAAVILVGAGTLPSALSWGAGAAVAMYCLGPGSHAPRRQLRRMSAAVIRTRGVLLVACISTMALALAVVSSALSQPPLIWPATSSTIPHLLPTINVLPSVGGTLHSVQGWLLRHTVRVLHLP
jgi:predicted Ser/Thr protein kinase